ncbi:MAG: ATP-dependent DNA ligase [Anaerolineales bacterium]|nr:ATP-dependent DNA ligase [Anaerolineales bacterium]MCB9126414.1 ATP-dependent DNA ligase [Ardenticatenales bacterium]MCB9171575.1 ATP-dependent DNA ligase [Ardenticatenales bacterium]
MKRFTDLYSRLDSTTKTNEKIAAMVDYFNGAPAADAAWAIYFLSGRRPKRLIQSRRLREWAAALTDIPDWLLVECHSAVGDSAETAALLLPAAAHSSDLPLHQWLETRILPLRELDDEQMKQQVLAWWATLDGMERFVLNKLLTGSFRVGVSQRLLTRALAQQSGIDEATVAHRLMGHWEPTPDFVAALLSHETTDADVSRPYPFFLAYALEETPVVLGSVEEWLVEWKWDGIRAQLVRRHGQSFLWSRGEELVSDRYPEVIAAAEALPDGTVLDGELLAWADGKVLPFAQLQRRIGRKSIGKKLLRDVPVLLLCYDLLEWQGKDVRHQSQWWRRERLAELLAAVDRPHLPLSEIVESDSWEALATIREESRDRLVEGFMLKRKSSPYRVGRRRGDWWKWKIDPYTIDAVLIYAQRGSGRRASLYSDYTFAVWDEGELVPFAKAYSGLTDAEMRRVDNFVRRNTRERFGPVRSVTPKLVFELAFENIQRSNRHKSGIAVRFPRILRWREDKQIEEADTLDTIKAMLP